MQARPATSWHSSTSQPEAGAIHACDRPRPSTRLLAAPALSAALRVSHVGVPPLPLGARAPLPPPAAAAALLSLLLDHGFKVTPLLLALAALPLAALPLLPTVVVLPAGGPAATAPHLVAAPPPAALLDFPALLPALLPLLLLLPHAALAAAAALLAAAGAQPQAAGGHALRGLHIFHRCNAEDERDGGAGLAGWGRRGSRAGGAWAGGVGRRPMARTNPESAAQQARGAPCLTPHG